MTRVALAVCGLLAAFAVPLLYLLLGAAAVLSFVGEDAAAIAVVAVAVALAVYNLGVEVGRLDPPRFRR